VEISTQEASKYMRLGNSAHERNLDSAASIQSRATSPSKFMVVLMDRQLPAEGRDIEV
jgi:hypothetical protein